MEEIWKEINGFEKLYMVSNTGKVKRVDKNKKLKLYTNKNNGYIYVNLSGNGKNKVLRVHKIVAEAFIPNKNKYKVINHKDGNKQNNRVDNLEWCTQKQNINHAKNILKIDFSKGIEKMHEKNKKKIIRNDGKIYKSIKEAKKDLGNMNAHICEVCKGKLKTTCGYSYRYYE